MVRIVCISDTHGKHRLIDPLPPGDVLIHAGDFTRVGEIETMQDFIMWMDGQPFIYKVLIAGNHDVTLDRDAYDNSEYWQSSRQAGRGHSVDACRTCVTSSSVKYLQDSLLNLDFAEGSLAVYGSPWQLPFGNDWAFNSPEESILEHWRKIPSGVDVLVTHGPPFGILDYVPRSYEHAGSLSLLQEIESRVYPRMHVFGHIHEGYGTMLRNDGGSNVGSKTLYVNASCLDVMYRPVNRPIICEIPLNSDIIATHLHS